MGEQTYTEEKDVAPEFDVGRDEEGSAQRDLTDFVVTRGDEKISICSLDNAQESAGSVVARGRIVNKNRSLRVVTDPLEEWCIEYGATPCLWVRSKEVWYRLQKPAREYAKTHELARRRFEICSRIYILATTMRPGDTTYAAFIQLLSGPYFTMRGYTEKDILQERDFILAQVENLNDLTLDQTGFVKDLRDKKGPGGNRKSSASSSKKASASASAGEESSQPYAGPWVPKGGLDDSAETKLLRRAEKAVSALCKSKNAWPFLEPVNPVAHGCPDYLTRIKKPMDFGTIKSNISKARYRTAMDITKDIRLVASNCREYNGNHHHFAIWATELERKFENGMRVAEEQERAAMEKRLNGNNGAAGSSKKKKSSSSDPVPVPSTKSSSAAQKSAARVSKKVSNDAANGGSPMEMDNDEGTSGASVGDKRKVSEVEVETQEPCAREAPEACKKMRRTGSKYCSDECGLLVARGRLDEMMKSGFDVEEFLHARITKTLVQSRAM